MKHTLLLCLALFVFLSSCSPELYIKSNYFDEPVVAGSGFKIQGGLSGMNLVQQVPQFHNRSEFLNADVIKTPIGENFLPYVLASYGVSKDLDLGISLNPGVEINGKY